MVFVPHCLAYFTWHKVVQFHPCCCKSTKKQVFERLWRKGNPSAPLVGIQTGEATVENSIEFPQKTKNGTAF